MGLTELDNTPRPVAGLDTSAGGSLEAMMLDMKRTFDEIVQTHSEPGRAEAILANPFYQSLSSSMAGTQEYMAMEKLGQLRRTNTWDLIVVDTPPSRSALDFLDAPKRLGSFLDGRVIKILAAPAKAGGKAYLKVVSVGFNMVAGVVTKVLGAQLLKDVAAFVAALETMFGGFRERADETFRLLKNPETRFLVVAAPEPDALREASYFVERLSEERMPLAGLVLNRVHSSGAAALSPGRALAAAEDLDAAGDSEELTLTAALLRLHAERMTTIAREESLSERFSAAHPTIPVGEVAAQPADVHDLDGLRIIGAELAKHH
jgi:anion-transporting  ArsA/GET3 family ATPase